MGGQVEREGDGEEKEEIAENTGRRERQWLGEGREGKSTGKRREESRKCHTTYLIDPLPLEG